MSTVKWYLETGAELDVAVSTRVRLARNINGLPFPGRLSAADADVVIEKCRAALKNPPEGLPPLDFFLMESMDDSTRLMLVESRVISPDFAGMPEGRALALSRDESISVMINEEDHIRIQVMRAGLDLEGAYAIASALDAMFCEALDIAFDDQLGFLTCCPTNLGTGLRASVMLHMPALSEQKELGRLSAAVSKIGLTLRGSFGEGTKPRADMYQLSNQVTLGLSEQDAIKNLGAVTGQVIARERKSRGEMDRTTLLDSVYRAKGLLQNAQILSTGEFMSEASKLRMGVAMNLFDEPVIALPELQELMNRAGAASIIKLAGRPLEAAERDNMRASLVRETLNTKV